MSGSSRTGVRIVWSVLLLALAIAPMANADWIPDDGHKMHFPQMPNVEGWDVNATNPIVLADDWVCSETGWVKDIHFWGSWMHGIQGQIISFNLSIHEDIPAAPPEIPYSRPGATLWEEEITEFIVATPVDPPGPEGWYDPSHGTVFPPPDHMEYFQYNVFLPEQDWFWQEEGHIYWLNISATVADPTTTQWGWKSTLDRWNDDATWALWGDLQWFDMFEPPDFAESLNLAFVITGEPPQSDTCEYYKARYPDYAPQGMPDFDMKQAGWTDLQGNWSHDGPAALANCLWWFDSKFEPNPIDPRPFFPGGGALNDNYPLVTPYGAAWDDHDTNNVQPFITDLATNFLNTNSAGGTGGTTPANMVSGLQAYLAARGMSPDYQDTIVFLPPFEYIQEQVLASQDVILLFSFYEDQGTHTTYIGSHWVTVAGVCTEQPKRQICISDPYLDWLEGEPPAGSAHGGTIHNDADNISGPHSQIHHDPYPLVLTTLPGWTSPVEVVGYTTDAAMIANFTGLNFTADWTPWGGGQIYTTIDLAWVICPSGEVFDTVKCEPQGGQNPTHPPTYWYDVIPGDAAGRYDFHVKVYDSVLANYSNFVEPTGWNHLLQKFGSDWWLSWCDPTGGNPLTAAFRFQFDHQGSSAWSDWRTTNDGTCNPFTGIVDSAENHSAETNGYGYLVHAPQPPPPPTDLVECEPQGGQNPNHPPTYWFDVTPSGARCDFHVKVFDSVAANYSNWVEPTGWVHSLHKVASDWWVSWYSPGCASAIFTTFRFQFDNSNPSTWSDWATTQSGTDDPHNTVIDSSGNHTADANGYGYLVHVPRIEEGYNLKWEQPPDLTELGMDVLAAAPQVVLADDFLCTETGPIREIHIYGSWLNDQLPMGDPGMVAFHLSLHADIPEGPNGWSIPGEVLWSRDFFPGQFFVAPFFQGPEGFFYPQTDEYIPMADFTCWEYIFPLDSTEFIQQGTEQNPVIYWLDVQATVELHDALFGWKTSMSHWNDDAVYALGVDPPVDPWIELRYPPQHPYTPQSIDLAFSIYGQTGQILGACCNNHICTQTDSASCAASGGYYVGDSWPCTPDPCCCQPPTVGNIDGIGGVTLGDLSVLIDHLFISLNPLPCWPEGNVDLSSDNAVTLSDLSVLIDHLFISLNPLPPCPW